MTKQELIAKAIKSEVDNEQIQFISDYNGDAMEQEIVAVLVAWLTNGVRGEMQFIRDFMHDVMSSDPKAFIADYPLDESFKDYADFCFFHILTRGNAHKLFLRLHEIYYVKNKSIEELVLSYIRRKGRYEVRYVHEALAVILGGNTGLPTKNVKGTFYRYNVLAYWLIERLRLWTRFTADDKHSLLLPCTDTSFDNAYRYGVFKNIKPTNLTNTINLTFRARMLFGIDKFYDMYPLLNANDNG